MDFFNLRKPEILRGLRPSEWRFFIFCHPHCCHSEPTQPISVILSPRSGRRISGEWQKNRDSSRRRNDTFFIFCFALPEILRGLRPWRMTLFLFFCFLVLPPLASFWAHAPPFVILRPRSGRRISGEWQKNRDSSRSAEWRFFIFCFALPEILRG